jgi:hypothetical protein
LPDEKADATLLLILDGLDEVAVKSRTMLEKWISNNLMHAAGLR